MTTRDNTKRKRPQQTGQLIGVRLQPDQVLALDRWIETQGGGMSRPAALRLIMRNALRFE